MRGVRAVPVVLAGLLLIAHGLAHAPGILGSFDLATFEDASRQPNLLFTGAGDFLIQTLGVVWTLAALSFVVAGAGVLFRRAWSRTAAWVAVALSLPVTVLWYQDAIVGLVLNVSIAVVLVATRIRESVSSRQMAPTTG
jgi:hypothetical protein